MDNAVLYVRRTESCEISIIPGPNRLPERSHHPRIEDFHLSVDENRYLKILVGLGLAPGRDARDNSHVIELQVALQQKIYQESV